MCTENFILMYVVYVIIKVDSVLNCIMIHCNFIFNLYILNHNKIFKKYIDYYLKFYINFFFNIL